MGIRKLTFQTTKVTFKLTQGHWYLIFGITKLESLDILWRCLRHSMFSRFSRTLICDRQTDTWRPRTDVLFVFILLRWSLGEFKREDLAQTVLTYVVQDLVQTTHLVSNCHRVKRIFFTGGFCSSPLVRSAITTHLARRNMMQCIQGHQVAAIQTHGVNIGLLQWINFRSFRLWSLFVSITNWLSRFCFYVETARLQLQTF